MRNMNQQTRQGIMGKAQLLRKIREYDFAIVETTLFLDTHPNNQKALSYYHKLKADRKKLVSEFENNFGPLTMYCNSTWRPAAW